MAQLRMNLGLDVDGAAPVPVDADADADADAVAAYAKVAADYAAAITAEDAEAADAALAAYAKLADADGADDFIPVAPARAPAAPPATRQQISVAIRRCYETLRGGGRRGQDEAFREFVKILYAKLRDERGDGGNLLLIPRNRPDDTDDDLADRVRWIYEREREQYPALFDGGIQADTPAIARCIEHLSEISFHATPVDIKGLAFQEFMSSIARGDLGQYFTPPELTYFAVAMLRPQADDIIFDPACGSGGFLLAALSFVRGENGGHCPGFAENNLYGYEVNEDLTRVAKLNLHLYGESYSPDSAYNNIQLMDALGPEAAKVGGVADLVFANPPFGLTLSRADLGDEYLDRYEVLNWQGKNRGGRSRKPPATLKAEYAFLERIRQLLKPGTGRAAVVVPDGMLSNKTAQGMRAWLHTQFCLMAVISLPPFTFRPYGSGIKTSLIILRRLDYGEVADPEHPIFMAVAENIGYDATGASTYSVSVEDETRGGAKTEIHSSDLLDLRVSYEWFAGEWVVTGRKSIPGSAGAGLFSRFLENPSAYAADKDGAAPGVDDDAAGAAPPAS